VFSALDVLAERISCPPPPLLSVVRPVTKGEHLCRCRCGEKVILAGYEIARRRAMNRGCGRVCTCEQHANPGEDLPFLLNGPLERKAMSLLKKLLKSSPHKVAGELGGKAQYTLPTADQSRAAANLIRALWPLPRPTSLHRWKLVRPDPRAPYSTTNIRLVQTQAASRKVVVGTAVFTLRDLAELHGIPLPRVQELAARNPEDSGLIQSLIEESIT
jgi:hypothetical protein